MGGRRDQAQGGTARMGHLSVSPGLAPLTSSPGWGEASGGRGIKGRMPQPSPQLTHLVVRAPNPQNRRRHSGPSTASRVPQTYPHPLGSTVEVRQLHPRHWAGNRVGQGSSQTGFSGDSKISLSCRWGRITSDPRGSGPKDPISPALQLLEAFPRILNPTNQFKSQPHTTGQLTALLNLSPHL